MIFHDLRYAARSLIGTPGFTCIAVITLALGIGGGIAVFCVLNAALLHTLPYPEPHDLIILHWQDSLGRLQNDISAPAFFLVKEKVRSLRNVAAVYPIDVGVNMTSVGSPQHLPALEVSSDFLKTLGVNPIIGRDFLPAEDQPGERRAAIISYGLWEQAFNKDPSILGRQVRINGDLYSVVGVTPQDFRSYPGADLWIPLRLSPANADPGSDYRVIARIANGFGRHQVGQELKALSDQYKLRYLSAESGARGLLVTQELHDFLIGNNRQSLILIFGAVIFLLLIACTNVAVLLLVRSSASDREASVRVSLGAGRFGLIRGFVMQGFLLAVAGGVLGTILAKESIPFIIFSVPSGFSLSTELRIDAHVLEFAFLTSLFSAVLFALLPAFKTSRIMDHPFQGLRQVGSTAGLRQTRLIQSLVIVETMLTFILVFGTVLLLQTLSNLHAVPLGFDTQHVSTAQVSLSGNLYGQTATTTHLFNRILEQLRRYPDVEAAAIVNGLPLEKGLNLPVYPLDAPDKVAHAAEYRIVSGDYFRALAIPLVTGHDFSAPETTEGPPVAIINQTLARRWWPTKSAIGEFVSVSAELGPTFQDRPRLVVGIVRDMQDNRVDTPPSPMVFVPASQSPDNITAFINKLFLTSIIVRTTGTKDNSRQIQNAVASADPDLPLASYRPLNSVVHQSLSRSSFVASLTGIFGSFALLLTASGLYGLLAYQVTLRHKEIAVRIILGATYFDVIKAVVLQGLALVAMGTIAGIAGAFFLKKLLESMLYNVKPGSMLALVGATVLMGVIALITSVLAAVRTAFLEPMEVLRSQ